MEHEKTKKKIIDRILLIMGIVVVILLIFGISQELVKFGNPLIILLVFGIFMLFVVVTALYNKNVGNFFKKYKETILWIIGIGLMIALALRGFGAI